MKQAKSTGDAPQYEGLVQQWSRLYNEILEENNRLIVEKEEMRRRLVETKEYSQVLRIDNIYLKSAASAHSAQYNALVAENNALKVKIKDLTEQAENVCGLD